MTVVVEDVLAAFLRRWTLHLVSVIIPGGLHLGQVRQDVETPYGTMVGATLESQFTSGLTIHEFEVTVSIWSDRGVVGMGDAAKYLADAFDWRQTPDLSIPGGTVLAARPTTGSIELDQAQRRAGDICLHTAHWSVFVEAR